MDLVAGPQGSGKSKFYPVKERGIDWFNIDERRKALNHGSSHDIPDEIRQRSRAELLAFITNHIETGGSFSFEASHGVVLGGPQSTH